MVEMSLWGEGIDCRRGRAALACRWLLPVLAALLAGCGGSSKSSPRHPRTSTVAVSQASQLVSMRRIDGATYETVVIRTDGTCQVGEFIGEWTGVVHQPCRVSSRELDQLRRFVELAAHTDQTPAFGMNPSTEYIIFTRGHVLETAEGHVPRELAGLTAMLSGLIDRYS